MEDAEPTLEWYLLRWDLSQNSEVSLVFIEMGFIPKF
jgi:hypothetical protein